MPAPVYLLRGVVVEGPGSCLTNPLPLGWKELFCARTTPRSVLEEFASEEVFVYVTSEEEVERYLQGREDVSVLWIGHPGPRDGDGYVHLTTRLLGAIRHVQLPLKKAKVLNSRNERLVPSRTDDVPYRIVLPKREVSFLQRVNGILMPALDNLREELGRSRAVAPSISQALSEEFLQAQGTAVYAVPQGLQLARACNGIIKYGLLYVNYQKALLELGILESGQMSPRGNVFTVYGLEDAIRTFNDMVSEEQAGSRRGLMNGTPTSDPAASRHSSTGAVQWLPKVDAKRRKEHLDSMQAALHHMEEDRPVLRGPDVLRVLLIAVSHCEPDARPTDADLEQQAHTVATQLLARLPHGRRALALEKFMGSICLSLQKGPITEVLPQLRLLQHMLPQPGVTKAALSYGLVDRLTAAYSMLSTTSLWPIKQAAANAAAAGSQNGDGEQGLQNDLVTRSVRGVLSRPSPPLAQSAGGSSANSRRSNDVSSSRRDTALRDSTSAELRRDLSEASSSSQQQAESAEAPAADRRPSKRPPFVPPLPLTAANLSQAGTPRAPLINSDKSRSLRLPLATAMASPGPASTPTATPALSPRSDWKQLSLAAGEAHMAQSSAICGRLWRMHFPQNGIVTPAPSDAAEALSHIQSPPQSPTPTAPLLAARLALLKCLYLLSPLHTLLEEAYNTASIPRDHLEQELALSCIHGTAWLAGPSTNAARSSLPAGMVQQWRALALQVLHSYSPQMLRSLKAAAEGSVDSPYQAELRHGDLGNSLLRNINQLLMDFTSPRHPNLEVCGHIQALLKLLTDYLDTSGSTRLPSVIIDTCGEALANTEQALRSFGKVPAWQRPVISAMATLLRLYTLLLQRAASPASRRWLAAALLQRSEFVRLVCDYAKRAMFAPEFEVAAGGAAAMPALWETIWAYFTALAQLLESGIPPPPASAEPSADKPRRASSSMAPHEDRVSEGARSTASPHSVIVSTRSVTTPSTTPLTAAEAAAQLAPLLEHPGGLAERFLMALTGNTPVKERAGGACLNLQIQVLRFMKAALSVAGSPFLLDHRTCDHYILLHWQHFIATYEALPTRPSSFNRCYLHAQVIQALVRHGGGHVRSRFQDIGIMEFFLHEFSSMFLPRTATIAPSDICSIRPASKRSSVPTTPMSIAQISGRPPIPSGPYHPVPSGPRPIPSGPYHPIPSGPYHPVPSGHRPILSGTRSLPTAPPPPHNPLLSGRSTAAAATPTPANGSGPPASTDPQPPPATPAMLSTIASVSISTPKTPRTTASTATATPAGPLPLSPAQPTSPPSNRTSLMASFADWSESPSAPRGHSPPNLLTASSGPSTPATNHHHLHSSNSSALHTIPVHPITTSSSFTSTPAMSPASAARPPRPNPIPLPPAPTRGDTPQESTASHSALHSGALSSDQSTCSTSLPRLPAPPSPGQHYTGSAPPPSYSGSTTAASPAPTGSAPPGPPSAFSSSSPLHSNHSTTSATPTPPPPADPTPAPRPARPVIPPLQGRLVPMLNLRSVGPAAFHSGVHPDTSSDYASLPANPTSTATPASPHSDGSTGSISSGSPTSTPPSSPPAEPVKFKPTYDLEEDVERLLALEEEMGCSVDLGGLSNSDASLSPSNSSCSLSSSPSPDASPTRASARRPPSPLGPRMPLIPALNMSRIDKTRAGHQPSAFNTPNGTPGATSPLPPRAPTPDTSPPHDAPDSSRSALPDSAPPSARLSARLSARAAAPTTGPGALPPPAPAPPNASGSTPARTLVPRLSFANLAQHHLAGAANTPNAPPNIVPPMSASSTSSSRHNAPTAPPHLAPASRANSIIHNSSSSDPAPAHPHHPPNASSSALLAPLQIPPAPPSHDPSLNDPLSDHPPFSHHPQLHLLLLELILDLLLTPAGTLDPRYCVPDPTTAGIPNILFILHTHLTSSFPALPTLVAQLLQSCTAIGPAATRLLRLLVPGLFRNTLYKGLEIIGRGQYASVYEAQLRLGNWDETVIIKSIDTPKSLHDVSTTYDCFNEVSILERLSPFPQVCRILDYGISASSYWLILKRYHCTLRKWRSKAKGPGCKPPHVRTYLRIFQSVVDAAARLADCNVVHYDLKCDNVLLEVREGVTDDEFWGGLDPEEELPFRVVLADFGESVLYPDLQDAQPERSRGTEAFMSPEMLAMAPVEQKRQQKNFDRRKQHTSAIAHDVWSLGCLFFELLTDRLLFVGEDQKRYDPAAVQNRVMRGLPDTTDVLSAHEKGLLANHQPLVNFFQWLMVRDAATRPTLKDLQNAIARLLASETEADRAARGAAAAAAETKRAKKQAAVASAVARQFAFQGAAVIDTPSNSEMGSVSGRGGGGVGGGAPSEAASATTVVAAGGGFGSGSGLVQESSNEEPFSEAVMMDSQLRESDATMRPYQWQVTPALALFDASSLPEALLGIRPPPTEVLLIALMQDVEPTLDPVTHRAAQALASAAIPFRFIYVPHPEDPASSSDLKPALNILTQALFRAHRAAAPSPRPAAPKAYQLPLLQHAASDPTPPPPLTPPPPAPHVILSASPALLPQAALLIACHLLPASALSYPHSFLTTSKLGLTHLLRDPQLRSLAAFAAARQQSQSDLLSVGHLVATCLCGACSVSLSHFIAATPAVTSPRPCAAAPADLDPHIDCPADCRAIVGHLRHKHNWHGTNLLWAHFDAMHLYIDPMSPLCTTYTGDIRGTAYSATGGGGGGGAPSAPPPSTSGFSDPANSRWKLHQCACCSAPVYAEPNEDVVGERDDVAVVMNWRIDRATK